MTKPNFTSINVIIDKSGSMHSLTESTIEGFNKFLEEQKKVPGEALLTLCTFNHKYQLVYDCTPLNEVKPLDNALYIPDGTTALNDAVGRTIDDVGAKLAAMKEEDRPSKVLFVIITDGQENSSKDYTRNKIKSMVEHQQSKYSWDFIFMGANIDAIAEGDSLGIMRGRSYNYSANSVSTKKLYQSISDNTTSYRGSSKGTFDFDINADKDDQNQSNNS